MIDLALLALPEFLGSLTSGLILLAAHRAARRLRAARRRRRPDPADTP
ncbi:hypothetical protein [Streptomyces youssoufiensis]